jgi:ABC-type transport system involved in multi-copper enzyme maturation permease subunit
MSVSRRRVRAVFRKELREFQHNGNIIYATAILPLVFLIQPLIQVFTLSARAAGPLRHEHSLLYMLAIPVLVPATLAAYSVVGERLQGTLEPLLTTPVSREELLLGKALAAFLPSVLVSYAVFAIYLGVVELFAPAQVVSAVVRGPDLLAQLVFTPLLAIWSIWVGIAVSARSRDPRTAAQLALFASLPTVAVTTLVAFNAIRPTVGVALGLGAMLVTLVGLGARVATSLFDRERLIVNTR